MKRDYVGLRRSPYRVRRIAGKKPSNENVGVRVMVINRDHSGGFGAMGFRCARLVWRGIRYKGGRRDSNTEPVSSSHIVAIVIIVCLFVQPFSIENYVLDWCAAKEGIP